VLLTEPPLVAIVAELKFSTVVSIKQATFVDFNIYVYIYTVFLSLSIYVYDMYNNVYIYIYIFAVIIYNLLIYTQYIYIHNV